MRRSFKTCGNSNALDGSQDDTIYDNETPEVADDDSRLTTKRTTMTKNLNCMKFSQKTDPLGASTEIKVTVMSEICVC